MLNTILNEKEYIEEHIKNKDLGDSPKYTLQLAARYYYSLGKKESEILEQLRLLIKECNPLSYEHQLEAYRDELQEIVKNAAVRPLTSVQGVGVTQKEIDAIQSLNNKKLERLAFTILVLGKLSQIKNPENEGWLNTTDTRGIFTCAKVDVGAYERDYMIGDLRKAGLIQTPIKIGTLNYRPTFIDMESQSVLFVTDMRELGNEYRLFTKDGNYLRCPDCGRLVRTTKKFKGKTKYCKACAKERQRVRDLEYRRNRRKKEKEEKMKQESVN